MYYLYYLLYQIKNDKNLWIVTVDDDCYKLKNIITKVNNDYENYYIIEREFKEDEENLKIINNELERVHFRIFNKIKYDKLIYYT